MIVDTRIVISALWVALMLSYLLGDVLRIFAGDYTAGELAGKPATPAMWLGIAILRLIPIVMVVLSLVLPFPAVRWVTTIAAAFLVVFNLAALPYPGAYDNFLTAVGIAINGLTIWQAWVLTA